jgi:hypothetical protein
MATTYVSISDLDSILDNFVSRYYGTYLDQGEDLTIGLQYYDDMNLSFDQTNEILSGISHIKEVPVGTQNGGNYPYHVRMLQANLMIYNRLRGKHFGEFTDGVPGWVNVYLNRSQDIVSAIRGEDVVFGNDFTQGEQGIGVGSWVGRAGTVNMFTNWETGHYAGDDFPRWYVVEIDGTVLGNSVGSSTFKWSKNGGLTWEEEGRMTDVAWVHLAHGAMVRWEPIISGTTMATFQCAIGDRFGFRCVPQNIPVKAGQVRFVTFRRG